MNQALQFNNVAAIDEKDGITFSVPAGGIAALVSTRQHEFELIVRLALGLEQPAAGSILTLGRDVGLLPEKGLHELRTRVGVVHPSGGLISNLKAWENLVLPLEYRSTLPLHVIRERGADVLGMVGYTGKLMELPGHLSLYSRRLIGLARAMLTDPDLIFYNNILDGLSDQERNNIISAAMEFHRERPGRSSLFMIQDQETAKCIDCECRIILKGSELHG